MVLVDRSQVAKVEIYNFRSLAGVHTFTKENIEIDLNAILASEWVMGRIKLNKIEIIPNRCCMSSVSLTISNPKLFLHEDDIVLVERRMYSFQASEFFIQRKPATLSAIKEMLSIPYNDDTLQLINKLSRSLGY